MRLLSQDSELLVILQVLLDKITDSLKSKKCLVITPSSLNLPEENVIKKEKDFSFKAEFLTADIKNQAKANERDLGKRNQINNSSQTANFDALIREQMGNNCFLTNEWQNVYNISFGTQPQLPMSFNQFKTILDSPCPFESGKRIRDTHFFFWMPEPKTVLEWQDIHPEGEQPKFYEYDGSWYEDEDFAKKTKTRFNCYLIYKRVVPGSIDKSYQNQKSMLPREYEPCLACEFAPVHLLYYQKTNEYLNDNIYGRCQDTASDGNRVGLGAFDSGGLTVGRDSGGDCTSYLGVSALRKLFS